MNELHIETTRGPLTESVHRVSAVVVDAQGRRVAWGGSPDMVTFWRSSAKPFQASPLISDGVADSFGIGDEELALICASHSSEPGHLELLDRLLERIGCTEDDLACGPHQPLSEKIARRVVRENVPVTPRWSNCSGNHAGMLALARYHGWPLAGYNEAPHPVQRRLLEEIARWTGTAVDDVVLGVDGCTTVCYGLPLPAMALAYARLAKADDEAGRRIHRAMTTYPRWVGGEGRPCTDIMAAARGSVLVKIGAEGVYGACLVGEGLGIALKVEDGGMRSAPIALIEVLRQLADRGLAGSVREWLGAVERHAGIPVRDTRGAVIGELRPAGALRFSA